MILPGLIADFRRELAEELPLQLHAGNQTAERGDTTYGHMTGLPFSLPFDRYLAGSVEREASRHWRQHGGQFVAEDAFVAVREWCRTEHYRERHTSEDPFAWNLCARITIAAVELRQPLHAIAALEEIDLWLARQLLTGALTFAADWRRERRKGVAISDASRVQLDTSEPLSVVLSREHQVGGEQRVWEALRRTYPFLRPWESELARRREFHVRHCGPACPLPDSDAA